MRVEDKSGTEIRTIDEWSKLYDTPQTSHQWKKGRSAYSTAEFLINRNGGEALQNRVSEALGKTVVFERAVPEYEVRFDEYGRGRMHDIALFGNTGNDESVFVGVEAKVDEPFGISVLDNYLASKAKQIVGASTRAPERIEKLLSLHFREPDISMFDIRYQLLYATAGTIAAGADISVLFVIVFKTELYNESIGAENYKDYIQFLGQVGASPIRLLSNEAQGHEMQLQGKRLICLYEYFEL
jgi:uncharacterized protein DUF6946